MTKLLIRSDAFFAALLIGGTAFVYWPVYIFLFLILTGQGIGLEDLPQHGRHAAFAMLYSLAVGMGLWRLRFARGVIWRTRRDALWAGLAATIVLAALLFLHLVAEQVWFGLVLPSLWSVTQVLLLISLMYMLPLSVFLTEELKRRARVRDDEKPGKFSAASPPASLTRSAPVSDDEYIVLFGAGAAAVFFPIYSLYVAVTDSLYFLFSGLIWELLLWLVQGAVAAWVAARVCFYSNFMQIRPRHIAAAALLALFIVIAVQETQYFFIRWWFDMPPLSRYGIHWDDILSLRAITYAPLLMVILPFSLLLARNLRRRALTRLDVNSV